MVFISENFAVVHNLKMLKLIQKLEYWYGLQSIKRANVLFILL